MKFECPCCGSRTLDDRGHFDICDFCNWEDDAIQSDEPDYEGGANRQSLNQARRNLVFYGWCDGYGFCDCTRQPEPPRGWWAQEEREDGSRNPPNS